MSVSTEPKLPLSETRVFRSFPAAWEKLCDLVVLCRPTHIVKNSLVLLPFALTGFEADWTGPVIAFICFSLMAMAVYALNDTLDAFYDMSHPTKCHRPVAAGRITERQALTLTTCLFGASVVLSAMTLGFEPTLLLVVYFVLNVFYSHIGKEFAIIDITIIAAGFVLRYLVGLSVTNFGTAQDWLVLPLFFATLCLAVGKRLAKTIRATDGSKLRISAFYTKSRATMLTVLFSNIAVIILTGLAVNFSEFLTIYTHMNAWALALAGGAMVLVWSRVLAEMLVEFKEPTEILTRDRATLTLLLGSAGIVSADYLLVQFGVL